MKFFMKTIRILIADDYRLLREAWREIFKKDPGLTVVADSGTVTDAVALAKKMTPDIVLMGIDTPQYAGLEATEKILAASPRSRVIGLCIYSRSDFAKRMFRSGASGYITKNCGTDEMIRSIHEVSRGNKYICNEIKQVASEDALTDRTEVPDINSLTAREKQIADMVITGNSSKEIGNALYITLKTVEVHRHNILKKLKVRNVASLVNFINSAKAMI
jgi:DNA-binding NarL/FixJ family response regulator